MNFCEDCKHLTDETVDVEIDLARSRWKVYLCSISGTYVNSALPECDQFKPKPPKAQPCPKCGGSADVWTSASLGTDIRCQECGLRGPDAEGRELATIEWNRLRYETE